MRVRRMAAALLGAVAVAAVGFAIPAAASGSDSFAERTALGVPETTSGSSAGATDEAGEPKPTCASAGRSVWFSVTVPEGASVRLSTRGSAFDTVLAVYTGDALDALTQIACNDDSYSAQSEVVFTADAGTSYAVQLTGYQPFGGVPMTGAFTLTSSVADGGGGGGGDDDPVLDNDDRAEARVLTGSPVSVVGTLVGSTVEAGEPGFCENPRDDYMYSDEEVDGSVWYSYTPPHDGLLRFSLDTYNAVELFTTNDFDSLVSVHCAYSGYGTRRVSGGQPVLIRVVSQPDAYFGGGQVEFTLDVEVVPAPGHDQFAAAHPLAGVGARHETPFYGATEEPGEPYSYGSGTVWYRLELDAPENIVISTEGSDFDTTLTVYRGSSLSDLSPVASSDDAGGSYQSAAGFQASPDTTYWIQASGYPYTSSVLHIAVFRGRAIDNGIVSAVVADDGTESQTGAGTGGAGVLIEQDEDGDEVDVCAVVCLNDVPSPAPLPRRPEV